MTRDEFARGEFALGYMFGVALADGRIRLPQTPENNQKGKEKRK